MTAIRSLPTSTGRRTLQSDTDGGAGAGIAVDFEILAVEGEVAEAESAAVALQVRECPPQPCRVKPYVCAWCVFVVTVLLGVAWMLSLSFFILSRHPFSVSISN